MKKLLTIVAGLLLSYNLYAGDVLRNNLEKTNKFGVQFCTYFEGYGYFIKVNGVDLSLKKGDFNFKQISTFNLLELDDEPVKKSINLELKLDEKIKPNLTFHLEKLFFDDSITCGEVPKKSNQFINLFLPSEDKSKLELVVDDITQNTNHFEKFELNLDIVEKYSPKIKQMNLCRLKLIEQNKQLIGLKDEFSKNKQVNAPRKLDFKLIELTKPELHENKPLVFTSLNEQTSSGVTCLEDIFEKMPYWNLLDEKEIKFKIKHRNWWSYEQKENWEFVKKGLDTIKIIRKKNMVYVKYVNIMKQFENDDRLFVIYNLRPNKQIITRSKIPVLLNKGDLLVSYGVCAFKEKGEYIRNLKKFNELRYNESVDEIDLIYYPSDKYFYRAN